MKNKKFISQAAICLMATMLPLTSCDTDGLQELNINPNAHTDSKYQFLVYSSRT